VSICYKIAAEYIFICVLSNDIPCYWSTLRYIYFVDQVDLTNYFSKSPFRFNWTAFKSSVQKRCPRSWI